MTKRFPWKSGYRKIPIFAQDALDDINSDLLTVAATKKIKRRDIEEGQYSHVGLSMDGPSITTTGPTQPPADAGKSFLKLLKIAR